MKLIFAVLQNEDAKPVTDALIAGDIRVTRVSSSGGFLRGGNALLMIGLDDDRVAEALDTIQSKSHKRTAIVPGSTYAAKGAEGAVLPIEINVGGAIVFVVDVEQFHRF